MGIELYWNWTAFIIGFLSTFALRFLRDYSIMRKTKAGFMKYWKFEDYIYILLGGLFTVAIEPINIFQAIVFGASWEPLFVRLVEVATKKGNGENDDKK